jgi:hypothetical protein
MTERGFGAGGGWGWTDGWMDDSWTDGRSGWSQRWTRVGRPSRAGRRGRKEGMAREGGQERVACGRGPRNARSTTSRRFLMTLGGKVTLTKRPLTLGCY